MIDDNQNATLLNIYNQFIRGDESLRTCWAQLVLKYDRENNSAILYAPQYSGQDNSPHILHPLIQTFTELKIAFDKEIKESEASFPGKMYDLFTGCKEVTVNKQVSKDELNELLNDIQCYFGFPHQKTLAEIGPYSYHWLGRYIEWQDWFGNDDRWNALQFEKLLTVYMGDLIRYYCEYGYKKKYKKLPSKIESLEISVSEFIYLTINEKFLVEIPFFAPRGLNDNRVEPDISLIATAIVLRVFFQMSQHLEQYMDENVTFFSRGIVQGPEQNSFSPRDNDLIEIACNASLDLSSYLEQWSIYLDKHPDCSGGDDVAANFKRASKNPSAIQ